MTWHKGKQLGDGKYIIDKELGKGGFGIVYRAITQAQTFVVIKTLKDEIRSHSYFDKLLNDFANEALRLERCRHNHVVKVVEIVYEDGLPCVVMEYVDGESLAELLHQRSISELEALQYVQQIGEALTVVHAQGLLHRDIKPQNIMVRRSTHEAVLIDFGIARTFAPNVIQDHTKLFTPGFAPLEQYLYSAKRGAYTDVYALAATLYCVLTRRVPDDALDREEYRRNQGTDLLEPPQRYAPTLSDRVNKAIMKGMEIEAKDRPQTVKAWLELLAEPKVKTKPTVNVVANKHQTNTQPKQAKPPSKKDKPLPVGEVLKTLFSLGLLAVFGRVAFDYWNRHLAPPSIESFIAIQPRFASASQFSSGLASVQNKTSIQHGYINKSGNFVIQPKFSDALGFSDDLARVSLPSISSNGSIILGSFPRTTGYIDKSGKFVIQSNNPSISDTTADPATRDPNFHEGLAGILHSKPLDENKFGVVYKVGYIDKNGKIVIEPKFGKAKGFSEGRAAVTFDPSGSKWGYIDNKGNFAIQPSFDEARSFFNGLAAVRISDKWGYVDKSGNLIIQPKFETAGDFNDDVAPVKANNKWGYIDKSGNFSIQPKFNSASNFSEGLALVQEDGTCTYIDKSDNVIAHSPATRSNNGTSNCSSYSSFSEGLAAIKINNEWGYIRNPLSKKDL